MKKITPKSLLPASPSEFMLIAANMLPIAGVFLWDWSVFEMILAFWLENVIVGVVNLMKIASTGIYQKNYKALFVAPFFALHYGMFTIVHGLFVFLLFSDQKVGPRDGLPELIQKALAVPGMWITVIGLFASHLFSFVFNFLIRGEVKSATMGELMGQPYGRIVVLHMTLLIGAGIIWSTGHNQWAIVLLTFVKTIVDLAAHRRAHQGLSNLPQESYDINDLRSLFIKKEKRHDITKKEMRK